MGKRPVGFTVLALAFGWLALAGFGNAAINFAREGQFYSPITALLAFAYGITALVTMAGLWRVRAWAVKWLRAWMAACAVLMVWLLVGPFRIFEMPLSLEGPLLGVLAFTLFIVALFWALHRYVARKVELAA